MKAHIGDPDRMLTSLRQLIAGKAAANPAKAYLEAAEANTVSVSAGKV